MPQEARETHRPKVIDQMRKEEIKRSLINLGFSGKKIYPFWARKSLDEISAILAGDLDIRVTHTKGTMWNLDREDPRHYYCYMTYENRL